LGKTQACSAAHYYGLTTADNKLAKTEQIKNTKENLTNEIRTAFKGALRLLGTLAYSPYPPELDKSIYTFFISVHAVTLSDAPTASLA